MCMRAHIIIHTVLESEDEHKLLNIFGIFRVLLRGLFPVCERSGSSAEPPQVPGFTYRVSLGASGLGSSWGDSIGAVRGISSELPIRR